MYKKLVSKEATIAVIGLGYVGLPLALEFSKMFNVIGFDINESNIEKLKNKIDPSCELPTESFNNCNIKFTANANELSLASLFIIAVPTPIDKHRKPDLAPLLNATKTVAKYIEPNSYVIYESTVYPGCTREQCIPLLESISGLKLNTNLFVGYSPERINPGDVAHSLKNTTKIVSACNSHMLEQVAKIYETIVTAGVHKAPTIEVAEASKIMENTQRDVNIALMNEFSIIFGRMGINTYDVLEAAGTKWNFLKFYPGLVGGHCIGVDPYYMVYKANELNYHPHVIQGGRFVNDSMGGYIGKQCVKKMIANNISPIGANVLVMGFTFKENVADTRNSKVADIIKELKSYNVNVDIVDPYADNNKVKEEYSLELCTEPKERYHGIVIAVSHKEYSNLSQEFFNKMLEKNGVIVDVKGIYKDKISNFSYWSL